MPKILVITPVKHIPKVSHALDKLGQVEFIDDPSPLDLEVSLGKCDAIFTNPNKSRVYLGEELLTKASNLKVICTASTGTNHIDLEFAKQKNIEVLCLKDERDVIEKISSTAEHAFSLMLSSLRNIIPAHKSVLEDNWDYFPFIGKQLSCLNVGVLGFGRLGQKFAKYAKAFTETVTVYDPYKKIDNECFIPVHDICELAKKCDIISLHVHVSEETTGMIGQMFLKNAKKDVLLVNTSRGEILDEIAMVKFLKANPKATLATDVLRDEIRDRTNSPLLQFAKISDQVLITPHIGGMTMHAQSIAYNHAVNLLKEYFQKIII